jgi:RNA polymerase sigma-70 factor (ECF subfamily)
MRRYHAVVTASALRVSRHWGMGTAEEVDDVVQEIYLKFWADNCRVLTAFHASQAEAIFGYIKVVATNVAHDYFRRRAATKRGFKQTDSLQDTEWVGMSDEIELHLTMKQLDRLLIDVTQNEHGSRDRAIFRLYYRQGLTARNISELPGIALNQKGVEAALYRLVRAIRDVMDNSKEIRTP